MTKILVTYATRTGSTAGVARAIAKRLREEGAVADVQPVKDVQDVSTYDGVILGSAVRAGRWMPEATQFVEAQRDALAQRPVAVFSVCMAAVECKTEAMEAIANQMTETTQGLNVVGMETFAGAHDPKKLGLPMRLLLKIIKTPVGDYRDWDAIRGWAAELVSRMAVPQTA
jgi:menaquinone-dependent protoporphyrinogen oxidase